MAASCKLFILLSNLLSIFIFAFGIMSSWDSSKILSEAIKDVGRRKLSTKNHPGYISIDCGVEEDYLYNETGIYYKSDKDFINTGENRDVLPQYSGNQPWKEYDNLRSFPEGKRNCYTLKPEQGKNNYYSIRASFLYGNYDGKDEIPEFDLYVGVDYWDTVKLPSVWYKLFLEIIYFFSADTDFLCLVNTNSGVPFISALELRPSNNPFYNRTNHVALGRIGTYYLGIASNDSFRYKDDVYDRIWLPMHVPGSIPISTLLNINTQGSNGLPVEVLRTAIQPANGSTSLKYNQSGLSTSQYHVLLHFAEIAEIAQNRLREFSISLNGLKTRPIRLQYLKPLSVSSQNLTIQGEINITLDATPESDLPPILNAMEIYRVLHFSFSATDQSDDFKFQET